MKKILSISLWILLTTPLTAQVYISTPCTDAAQSQIKRRLYSGEIIHINVPFKDQQSTLFPMYSASSATSILEPASATPPNPFCKTRKAEYGRELINPEACANADFDSQRVLAYDQWSCQYAPSKAWDGSLETAWVEGVPGPGIGEVMLIPLDPRERIAIRSGISKSQPLFEANNRPARVRFHLLEVERINAAEPFHFLSIRQVASFDHSLLDRNEWQYIKPKWSPEDKVEKDRGWPQFILGIEILTVYAGTKFNDTAISEVKNH